MYLATCLKNNKVQFWICITCVQCVCSLKGFFNLFLKILTLCDWQPILTFLPLLKKITHGI